MDHSPRPDESPEADPPTGDASASSPDPTPASPSPYVPTSEREVSEMFHEIVADLKPEIGNQAPAPEESGGGWRTYSLAEETEEPFTPPPHQPWPSPSRDWRFWVAALGIGLGPLLMVYAAVVQQGVSSQLFWLGVVATIAGFGVVIGRLPDRRDDHDNGARV